MSIELKSMQGGSGAFSSSFTVVEEEPKKNSTVNSNMVVNGSDSPTARKEDGLPADLLVKKNASADGPSNKSVFDNEKTDGAGCTSEPSNNVVSRADDGTILRTSTESQCGDSGTEKRDTAILEDASSMSNASKKRRNKSNGKTVFDVIYASSTASMKQRRVDRPKVNDNANIGTLSSNNEYHTKDNVTNDMDPPSIDWMEQMASTAKQMEQMAATTKHKFIEQR